MKLNQIIAIEKGQKSRTESELTTAYKDLQKTDPYKGISRRYTPYEDEGEKLPDENQRVVLKVQEVVEGAKRALVELFDIVATKDASNCKARANVVVDGTVILTDVPATTLVFLEKQLVNVRTFISKIPTLDPGESWKFNKEQDCFASDPVETVRTKKVPKNHVKAEATQHHPAQVEVFYEDIPLGRWRTTKFSGCKPVQEVNQLLERVEKLQKAVKIAREEANNTEAVTLKVGENIFLYLFGG